MGDAFETSVAMDLEELQPEASPQAGPSQPRSVVVPGAQLLVELPNGRTHKITIPANATSETRQMINLPKIGGFRVNELLGKRYGLSFNLVGDGRLEQMDQEVVVAPEMTDATNEGIQYASGAQTLTADEILEMKRSGMSGEAIVARQIESNSQFSMKNEFSKSKYIARKEAKSVVGRGHSDALRFLKYVKIVPPTTFNIASHLFYEVQHNTLKNPWPRPDTLGQMLLQADIRPDPSSKILIAEDGSGLMTGAILSLLGGQGRALVLNEFDSPPSLQYLPLFQLSKAEQEPLRWLNWLQARKDYVPQDQDDDPSEEGLNDKRKARRKRRQEEFEARDRIREDLHAGGWQSCVRSLSPSDAHRLIIAAPLDPISVIDELLPYLAGSAHLVVYSETQQPLVQLCETLTARSDFLAPALTESTLRQYQVLPGRMHPEMGGLPAAGFILHAYRVLVGEDDAQFELPKKKRRR